MRQCCALRLLDNGSQHMLEKSIRSDPARARPACGKRIQWPRAKCSEGAELRGSLRSVMSITAPVNSNAPPQSCCLAKTWTCLTTHPHEKTTFEIMFLRRGLRVQSSLSRKRRLRMNSVERQFKLVSLCGRIPEYKIFIDQTSSSVATFHPKLTGAGKRCASANTLRFAATLLACLRSVMSVAIPLARYGLPWSLGSIRHRPNPAVLRLVNDPVLNVVVSIFARRSPREGLVYASRSSGWICPSRARIPVKLLDRQAPTLRNSG